MNFDANGFFFDSGEATTENKTPEWFWDDRLNNGKPLKFKVNNRILRYGGIRNRRILNDIQEIEVSGHWTENVCGKWQRVGSRK